MRSTVLQCLLTSCLLVLAFSSKPPSFLKDLPLPASVVHQYPDPTWIESIAVRSKGNLLLTALSSAQLLELDPSNPNSSQILFTFPGVSVASGITELEHDVFVVAAGNFSTATHSGTQGTWSFWKIDYTAYGSPNITKLLDVSEARAPNGLTTLSPGIVLVADPGLNSTWALNVDTLEYYLAIDVPQMTPPRTIARDLAVNGIEVSGQHLYWSDSVTGTFYRIKIDLSTGHAVPGARTETIANVTHFLDGFAFDSDGNAWITTDQDNTLIFLATNDLKHEIVTVDGALMSFLVAGDTSCAFGRGDNDNFVLYVATNGALSAPINGITEGGKVVAIDTRSFLA